MKSTSTKNTPMHMIPGPNDAIKLYIANNLLLIFPIFTYIIFNFFKENFFEGYAIRYIELFHMIVSTVLVFTLTMKNHCGAAYDPTSGFFQQPIKYALGLLFIINLFSIFNPCKQYMTFAQSNLFFLLVLFITFNGMNYYFNKRKDEFCSESDTKVMVFFLLLLNVALIYISK
jgi:hypothetical protein